MTGRVGVVTFPGSLDDGDAARAVRIAGEQDERRVVALLGTEVDLRHGA